MLLCLRRPAPDGAVARDGDDGEPGGTAERPVEVAPDAELVEIVVVVSRHFGGTLLGAGGLVRAYGSAAALAVRDAGVTVMQAHARLRVTVPYGRWGRWSARRAARGYALPTWCTRRTPRSPCWLVPAGEVDAFRARVGDLSAGQAWVTVEDTMFAQIAGVAGVPGVAEAL